jgi:hypothetical protein
MRVLGIFVVVFVVILMAVSESDGKAIKKGD